MVLLGVKMSSTDKKNGTVKWFNAIKGYGFIKPDDGGSDVFVHKSALNDSGIMDLNEGDRVNYETAVNRGRTSAVSLSIIS